MPQLDIFGNVEAPVIERAPETVIRQLVALGCDSDLAHGYTRRQAFAVLRRLKEKAERERTKTATPPPPRATPAPAAWEEPPARAGEDDEPVEHPEPLRWHLFPWDRPGVQAVIDGLDELRRLAPEVVLPRCVFWAIRHLPPGALVRLIDWLREELIDARERRGGQAASQGDPRPGGDPAAGGVERGDGGRGRDADAELLGAGVGDGRRRERDLPPHPLDAAVPHAGGLAGPVEEEPGGGDWAAG